MFEKTKTKLTEKTAESFRPIVTALWSIFGMLALIFATLVTRAN